MTDPTDLPHGSWPCLCALEDKTGAVVAVKWHPAGERECRVCKEVRREVVAGQVKRTRPVPAIEGGER